MGFSLLKKYGEWFEIIRSFTFEENLTIILKLPTFSALTRSHLDIMCHWGHLITTEDETILLEARLGINATLLAYQKFYMEYEVFKAYNEYLTSSSITWA